MGRGVHHAGGSSTKNRWSSGGTKSNIPFSNKLRYTPQTHPTNTHRHLFYSCVPVIKRFGAVASTLLAALRCPSVKGLLAHSAELDQLWIWLPVPPCSQLRAAHHWCNITKEYSREAYLVLGLGLPGLWAESAEEMKSPEPALACSCVQPWVTAPAVLQGDSGGSLDIGKLFRKRLEGLSV